MKRAFPNQVKAVDARETLNNITVEQSKQGIGGSNIACKSAAMIGLAISMGASGVLLHGSDDRVLAAEPQAADTTANNIQSSSQQGLINLDREVADTQTPTTASDSEPQQGQVFLRLTQGSSSSSEVARASNPLGSESLRPAREPKIPALPTLRTATKSEKTVTLLPEGNHYGLPQSNLGPASVISLDPTAQPRRYEDSSSGVSSIKPLEQPGELAQEQGVSPKSISWSQSSPQTFKRLSAENFVDLSAESSVSTNASASPSSEFSIPAGVTHSLDEADSQESAVGAVVIEPKLSEMSVSVLYSVKPGDTLDHIADAHGISVEALLTTNDIHDPNFLKVNQLLKVPQLPSQPSGNAVVTSQPEVETPSSVTIEPTLPAVTSSVQMARVDQPTDSAVKSSSLTPENVDGNPVARVDRPQAVPRTTTLRTLESGSYAAKGWQTQLAARSTTDEPKTQYAAEAGQPEVNSNPYAERLRAEIVRLREEYKAERELNQVSVVNPEAQVTPVVKGAQYLNPEFVTQQVVQDEMSSAQSREWMQEYQMSVQGQNAEVATAMPDPDVPTRPRQQVAVAPFTGSAYDPLKNPALGQMVSPELPPLPEADAYLPSSNGGSMQFAGYTWPAKGVLTSGYGWRWGRMHKGIDIAGPVGTPIVAAAPGVVTYADWNDGGYGYLVEIEHPNGSITLYAHNSRILVQKGQKVAQGQQISEMGSTGFSTGPHLHFEIHTTGQGAVNPMAYLSDDSSTASR